MPPLQLLLPRSSLAGGESYGCTPAAARVLVVDTLRFVDPGVLHLCASLRLGRLVYYDHVMRQFSISIFNSSRVGLHLWKYKEVWSR